MNRRGFLRALLATPALPVLGVLPIGSGASALTIGADVQGRRIALLVEGLETGLASASQLFGDEWEAILEQRRAEELAFRTGIMLRNPAIFFDLKSGIRGDDAAKAAQ